MQAPKKLLKVSELNEIKDAALHLKAIDNPLRLQILETILENNNSIAVSGIYNKMNLVQSITSGQLAILRKSHLVTIKREGKFIYYSVNAERMQQLVKLCQQINKIG